MNVGALLAAFLHLTPAADLPPTPIAPPETKAEAYCEKTCKLSETGIEFISTFEGYMPFPYADVAGIQTVGYGHVIRPGDDLAFPLLPPDAIALLSTDTKQAAAGVNKSVHIPLQQHQFDPLVSFTYNLGVGTLNASTLLVKVNTGKQSEIPGCFLMYNKARIDGALKVVPGLTTRRKAEGSMYAKQ